MRVRVWIDKKTAALAGFDAYELQAIEMKIGDLAPERRAELTRWDDDALAGQKLPRRLQADFYLDGPLQNWPEQWGDVPRLAEPTVKALEGLLDRILACRAALAARVIAEWEECQRKALTDRTVQVKLPVLVRDAGQGSFSVTVRAGLDWVGGADAPAFEDIMSYLKEGPTGERRSFPIEEAPSHFLVRPLTVHLHDREGVEKLPLFEPERALILDAVRAFQAWPEFLALREDCAAVSAARLPSALEAAKQAAALQNRGSPLPPDLQVFLGAGRLDMPWD